MGCVLVGVSAYAQLELDWLWSRRLPDFARGHLLAAHFADARMLSADRDAAGLSARL